jgi:two-component system CheB/CheR fusion protein
MGTPTRTYRFMPKRAQHPHFPIVGIGASAGGLEACSRLLDVLPSDTGMAFILIQHLDPAQDSLMAELLAKHTSMVVLEAVDGAAVAPNHVYVIPPGTYLSVEKGVLHLSKPLARHGARLPFDFLLHSLAENYGSRAIGVVLSGTGADGSIGLKAVQAKGGYVIAQDPGEADYGGMPRSAIDGGMVDVILRIADIAATLTDHDKRIVTTPSSGDNLPTIIELLRSATNHDFRLYKMGTLTRRIERRMALASIKRGDMAAYLEMLHKDAGELDLLAKDLLINVTSFFRDPAVFEKLSATVIPEMVANHPADQPLRLWIAGCSSGEEAYSLTILFREAIIAAQSTIKLQVFASDVDDEAVASARDGLYPDTITGEVSPDRLARFFVKEDHGYRVSPDLRSTVVFTVQDLLADPPFSRLDMVSCRNLLIYVGPEAQAKVIALFHFALCKGGILLLGNAETIPVIEGRFTVISKPERLYRHTGKARSGELGFAMGAGEVAKAPARVDQGQILCRQSALAELVQRVVMESHAPAAVLINRKYECLYAIGPTERYLKLASGHASHDLLAMAPQALRTRLRTVVQQIDADHPTTTTPGGKTERGAFNISVQSVTSDGEDLLLICFLDTLARKAKSGLASSPQDNPRIADLEQELDATRSELQGAIQNLEISGEEQRAINEEALSVNEEFQSTNEELLTSKEELQSLNEELTALNSQLQETLERQRTTSNDLQNVLYSTNVATLFLDVNLNIRFFTPATKSLFNVIPGDIGRPLADLHSLAADTALADDAHRVLHDLIAIDREIETESGVWFMRRIMPYRADNDGIEGVVITFTDITERKRAAKLIDDAKKEAELATVAKSRFLAVASHDLRQPLQTLALLQGLLGKTVQGEKAKLLIGRLDETLSAMTGMLNTLLDINQIDAGTVQPQLTRFAVNDLLDQLRDEFSYHAQAKKLELRVVRCGVIVQTDRRLLEQMLRNLISNAIKYTTRGKILIGCRRLKDSISIEIIDTGIGIANDQIHLIFDEYHQVDNAARVRSRGLGLGLSIVERLGKLLGHPVRVRSALGKGSAFAVEVMLPLRELIHAPAHSKAQADVMTHHTGSILIVDDDPEVRVLLELMLSEEGHQTAVAGDGVEALKLVTEGAINPDLVLTDYNLPNDMDGLRLAAKLREALGAALPIIILTGDISTETTRDVARQKCVQLNKPVKVPELSATIQRLLPVSG